ncbi:MULTISPECIES: helix-turn-helix transcriptional regulator [unclassified Staphylococcus]|uniref:helix-turn-helix transcriptional regulator n=2 Tax=Staphylococcus TaxID=1279 RepID=UPI001156C5E3|nr:MULTISPECIES: helix-turn-helix transcriptional regulator [unclassified Staphylococcus]
MIHKAPEVQTVSVAQDIKQLGGSSALLLGSEVMTLGRYLISLRKNKSVRQAAKEIGISHTYLDSLEKGYDFRTGKVRTPSVMTVYLLAKYYRVPMQLLFDLSIKDIERESGSGDKR